MTQTDSELRERRRAKILASKDARMARITGALKGDTDAASLSVDETVIQELIAEEKKQAVEVAKQEYAATHIERHTEKDVALSPEQVKQRKTAQVREQTTRMRSSRGSAILSLAVIAIAALAAVVLVHRYTPEAHRACWRLDTHMTVREVASCRAALFPVALQVLPGMAVIAILPVLSDIFKRRRPLLHVLLSIPLRLVLLLVIFIVALRTVM